MKSPFTSIGLWIRSMEEMVHPLRFITESIFSESAPQIKALVRSPSAFSTLFAPGKSWDNVRSTTAPYTESRLTRSVANERVGFPVVEQYIIYLYISNFKDNFNLIWFIHNNLRSNFFCSLIFACWPKTPGETWQL